MITITRRQLSEHKKFASSIYATYTFDVDGQEMKHIIIISPNLKEDLLDGKLDEIAINGLKENHGLK